MSSRILFEQTENLAWFRYEHLAKYLTSVLISLPVTICCFFVIIIFITELRTFVDLVIDAAIVVCYFLLMIGSNVCQAPLINPQWLFTSIRRLKIENKQEALLQYGYFPVCFRRRFQVKDIETIQLVKQRYGRGFDFFRYFISQANLHSLILILKDKKRIYLVDNETRNGVLAEGGAKLAWHLQIPFQNIANSEITWLSGKE